ncbi:MAG: Uncharacterised protein [Opitutia bacterium UBA7350]|nr:MAG: Uncharacterised protein [Opitutae bacterium UBA7350]
MDFSHYRTMDPNLLVGLVNTALRNHCESLQDFCQTHELIPAELIEKLKNAGYRYQPEQNQFR